MTKTIISGVILRMEDKRDVIINGSPNRSGYAIIRTGDGTEYYLHCWGKRVDLAQQFVGCGVDCVCEIVPRTNIDQERRRIFANCELKLLALSVASRSAPASSEVRDCYGDPVPVQVETPTSPPTSPETVRPFGRPPNDWERYNYANR